MDKQIAQEVCRLLKLELKRSGLSYRELAMTLDLSEVTVKRLLNNAQPLSLQRLVSITTLIEYPLSKLIETAEENVHTLAMFTDEQDRAFMALPALFTFWSKLAVDRLTVAEITEKYQLEEVSVYRYLRHLECVALIELGIHNQVKVLKPGHTAFAQGAQFPSFFTRQRLCLLQQRVEGVTADDKAAFLISLKAELTEEEFSEINQQLKDWMFKMLRQSQQQATRVHLNTRPYTFGFMAAKGSFDGALPPLENLQAAPM
nr:transcriptional regulator [Thaumasiovibrio subtropicus]